jgi:hypothetical protein
LSLGVGAGRLDQSVRPFSGRAKRLSRVRPAVEPRERCLELVE